MKKYIVLFLAVALFASCSDWLDITPKDRVLEDDLFSTEYGVYSANTGLYREMIAEKMYGGNLSQTLVEVMGHVYTYSPTRPTDANGNPQTNWALANFRYTEIVGAKSAISGIWCSCYSTLLHINTHIKKLDESPVVMPEKDKKTLLGEAYAMRAYIHFDLFRLFGPLWKNKNNNKILPYHNKTVVTMNRFEYEEQEYSTADEYMALLLQDIETAESLLRDNDPVLSDDNSITPTFRDDFFQNRNRRMNYYALKGLEARVRQYRGEHALAAAAAKVITDVIETNKDNSRFKWVDIARMASDNNYIFFGEVIFGIDNPDMTSQATKRYGGTMMRESYVIDAKNLFDNILGYGDSSLEGIIDIRSRQWSLTDITDFGGAQYSTGGSYKSKKNLKFSYPTNGTGIPAIKDLQVLMRVSEMYYIQAEAALSEGNKAEAARLLNTVLEHRGLTTQYFMTADKSDMEFQDHIEKEYYREFIGEGQIFFFHKRRGSTDMFKGYDAGSENVPYPSVDYVVPIPEEETNI